MAKKKTKPAVSAGNSERIVPIILCAFLFFLLVCLSSQSSIKPMVLLLALSFFIMLVLRFDTLQSRITLPLLFLLGWVLMDAVSTFYALSGKFALREVLKILAALLGCLYLSALDKGNAQQSGRSSAAVLSCASALAGVVSIDLLSTHLISTPILGLLRLFTSDYLQLSGVEAGIRMTSLFTNPNVFAGTVGIGTLLSLGLAATEVEKSRRNFYLILLYVNALSFVLAFSMGASAMIVAAFLLFLWLTPNSSRAQLLVLMVETLVLTLLCAMLISATSFSRWSGFQPIPLLCTLGGAAALCALEHVFHEKAAAIQPKAVVVLTGAALALLVVFAVVAVQYTGAMAMQAGDGLRRAAYPAAGEYTLRTEASGKLNVTIESQNKQQTMMHTKTRLYKGDAVAASFIVPEDSLVVYFNFSAEDDLVLSAASYDGAENGSLPLDYKLLPSFIANRLQGLFANENAIQRTVFFSDGMKLFRRSPVVGLGMGSFENAIKSVQEFFYETKYAHNHYIQTLLDTGIIGLILFTGTLVLSGISLWRTRKKHPLVPALAAVLVFMAGHAFVELVFSAYSYLPFALGSFAVISLCCADAFPTVQLGKRLRSGVAVGIAVFFAAWCLLLGGNMIAKANVERNGTFESITGAVRMDKFERMDYMLSYITSALDYLDDPTIRNQADAYAAQLESAHSNSLHIQIANYYFATDRTAKGFAEATRHITYTQSDPDMWRTVVDLLMYYDRDTAEYKSGVAEIAQLFNLRNQSSMGVITLSEEQEAYLAEALR